MDHLTLNWQQLSGIAEAPSSPGLYAVWDDQYIHGSDMLVYLGRADNLCLRLRNHQEWIACPESNTCCVDCL